MCIIYVNVLFCHQPDPSRVRAADIEISSSLVPVGFLSAVYSADFRPTKTHDITSSRMCEMFSLGQLLQLLKSAGNQSPKIVRVYSASQANYDYPIPRDLTKPRNVIEDEDDILRDYALHHIIRQPGKPHSSKLRGFDQRFKDNLDTPENVSDAEIAKYEKLVKEASVEELKNYDVIFCTCCVSSSPRIQRGTNVAQIIIDECAMCMEPETLIPLVTFRSAEKIVLIGDHKQLQPIVMNRDAKLLGLGKSLFERYAKNVTMLEEQYRMVRNVYNLLSWRQC
jgi:hypothetical protein